MINNIQALRAFAAINVVLHHIIGTSASYSQSVDFLRYLEGWGANGVDIFFVISGFVMLHTQLLQRRSPYQFLKNRVIRIVPIYWGISLFVLILYFLLPNLFREMVITPTWAISSFLFSSSVFADKPPIVYVGWTLEWEMFFYCMFAFGLFFKSWRIQTGFVMLSISIVSFFSGEFIALEFLFGMLVAYIYRDFYLGTFKGIISFIFGCFLLLLSLSSNVLALEINRVLLWGLPSFFVVLGLLYCPQIKARLFSYLGDASYSIYLIQMLTIPAFYKLSSKFMSGLNGDLLAIFCLFLSVIFGCMIYSLIEKPATYKIKTLLRW
jgi:exopolysaccharide production protein ExoZ